MPPSPTTAQPTPVRSHRVSSVDALRGLVMIIMALDHTREFFTASSIDPLDPARTTAALYFTRWVTHICAPTFVFLAGTSIFFQAQRRWRAGDPEGSPYVRRGEPEGSYVGRGFSLAGTGLSLRLLTRGLWLCVMELTIVHFVFAFRWQWNVQILEVIWAIGCSMIVMAALVRLRTSVVAAVGLVMVAGHNSLDAVRAANLGAFGPVWRVLHEPGFFTLPPTTPPIILVAYPLVPWIGVMALGYAFGAVVLRAPQMRTRSIAWGSAGLLLAGAVLRWTNLYGDPRPWVALPEWSRTAFSFLNLQKYPPSLLFLLATLGLSGLLLAALGELEIRGRWQRVRDVLVVYGRVPFFYFVLHIAVAHLLTLLVTLSLGRDWTWWIKEMPAGGVLVGRPPGYGFGLAGVWGFWILVVAICYPACRWYGRLKARSRNPLLSYL